MTAVNNALFFEPLSKILASRNQNLITEDRKDKLKSIANFIQEKLDKGQTPVLNFICTHNSRRSQLSQIWSEVASLYFNINVFSVSSGVEITEMNIRTAKCLVSQGFKIDNIESIEINPKYQVRINNENCIEMYSKSIDNIFTNYSKFLAIMVCSDADDNCPFIPEAEKRFSLPFNDPKDFDGTELELQKYQQRSINIMTEMFFLFSALTTYGK